MRESSCGARVHRDQRVELRPSAKRGAQAPPDFVFAVKASRFITHIKRLIDPEESLDLLLSRARHLKRALGPILFQLPPKFKVNLDRLDVFLKALGRRGSRWLSAGLDAYVY